VGLKVFPHHLIVQLQVGAHPFNTLKQHFNAAIDVALSRVSSWPHHVVNLVLILINLEVPDLLVGAQRLHKLTLLVLDLAFLHGVGHRTLLVLFSIGFFCRFKHKHVLALATLQYVFFNESLLVSVAHVFEALEKDVIFEVLQHVLVELAKTEDTIRPTLH
jgi:uncharacterized membrane protein YczE